MTEDLTENRDVLVQRKRSTQVAVWEVTRLPSRWWGCPARRRGFTKPAPYRPSRNPGRDWSSGQWRRPAHKPHSANKTVTVHYRFHPLVGTRVTAVEHRSHRGEPIVAVADSDGRRYHLPLWMTAPEAAQWALRERPRLSLPALSELRGLIAAWSAEPALPATGERDEIPEPVDSVRRPEARQL